MTLPRTTASARKQMKTPRATMRQIFFIKRVRRRGSRSVGRKSYLGLDVAPLGLPFKGEVPLLLSGFMMRLVWILLLLTMFPSAARTDWVVGYEGDDIRGVGYLTRNHRLRSTPG